MQRILIISTLFPPVAVGGFERRCARVANRLAKHHRVRVLTSNYPLSKVTDDGREPAANAALEIQRELPLVRQNRRELALGPIHAIHATARLRTSIADFEPDIIYVWKAAHLPHAMLTTLLATSLPIAFNFGDGWLSQLYGPQDPFTRHLYAAESRSSAHRALSRTYRAVDRMAPQLHLQRSSRRSVGVAWVSDYLRSISSLPDEVRPTREETILPFSPFAASLSRVERRPPGTGEVVFAGRVVEEKGIETAVTAMVDVVARRPGARLVVAGHADRAYIRTLRDLARSVGLADDVLDVRGMVDEGALGELFGRADVVVMPSTFEPAGLAALDAASARVPLVTTGVGGITELLRADEALFVEPGRPEDLAKRICQVLDEPAATVQRVERAFERSLQLSEDAHLARTTTFLENVINDERSPG